MSLHRAALTVIVGLGVASQAAAADVRFESDACDLSRGAARPAGTIPIEWRGFSASAFPATGSGSYEYRVKFSGTPTGVRLDLAGGGSVDLAPVDGGVWSATLTAAQILEGYSSADVNHNFVGYLRFVDGVDTLRFNVFVNVVDENVPPVTPVSIDAVWQRSCRVANLWDPDLVLPADDSTLQSIAQRFYGRFGDEFDFLNIVFTLPSYVDNPARYVIRNSIEGLGQPIFDDGAAWGSGAALLGVTRYPIETFFDLADNLALHEIGHQWINYCSLPVLAMGTPHWPPSTLARGPMGFNIPGSGGVGGTFPFDLAPQPNGDYRMVYGGSTLPDYTDLDLYLMGFLPPDSVGTHLAFSDPNQAVCDGCEGPVDTVTVADVIAAQGARVPDASAAAKRFRVGTIVVSRDRLLDANELAFYEHFAKRGEATEPLPYTSGFASGTAHPFRVATRDLGTLETWLLDECSPLASAPRPSEPHSTLRLRGSHPVRETAVLEWTQPARCHVRLDVFSVSGQRVVRLVEWVLEAGTHEASWSLSGRRAIPAGVYFARLGIDGRPAASRRIVIAR